MDHRIMECDRPLFTPSTPAAIHVSRLVYYELVSRNPSLNRMLLPEYLDYYTTACIWMRMISIKRANFQPLDNAESRVLDMISDIEFCVPEPIMLQLAQLGNVETLSGPHLRATFPTLPQEKIGGRGGYYGVLQPPGPGIDDSLHNLYEEIPCLGVLSEAIMHAISDEEPAGGIYRSVVTYEGLQPNQNLIGFRPLQPFRHPSARNVAFDMEISTDNFSEYPANTAMNFSLLKYISDILINTRVFRMSNVNFTTLQLSGDGSKSQTMISRPLAINGKRNIVSTIRTTSVARYSNRLFERAFIFCSQLMKDSGPNADHTTWCMISPVAGLPIPPQWVDNRNQRRNLPTQYTQEVFEGSSLPGDPYRGILVNNMVIA